MKVGAVYVKVGAKMSQPIVGRDPRESSMLHSREQGVQRGMDDKLEGLIQLDYEGSDTWVWDLGRGKPRTLF